MSEAEIAQGIFMLRYTMAKPPLDDQELHRFLAYMDSAFAFNNLLDFCLSSLDIEGGLSPRDEEAFIEIAIFIERELILAGHVVGSDDASRFVGRWWAQIAPLR